MGRIDDKISKDFYEEINNPKNIRVPRVPGSLITVGWPSSFNTEHHARVVTSPLNRDCKSILELGCGWGHATKYYREWFPNAEITAIDLNEKLIDFAKSTYEGDQVKFHCASFWDFLENAPLGSYDWIIGIGAPFEIIIPENRDRLFAFLVTRSRRGFSTFYHCNWKNHRDEWWEKAFSELRTILPEFNYGVNLTQSKARKLGLLGKEEKLELVGGMHLSFLDKGLNCKILDVKIPDHYNPPDNEKMTYRDLLAKKKQRSNSDKDQHPLSLF